MSKLFNSKAGTRADILGLGFPLLVSLPQYIIVPQFHRWSAL